MTTKQLLRKYYKKKKRKNSSSKKKCASSRSVKTKQKSKDAFKKRYYRYLKSEKWLKIRLDLYQIRGKKCEVCQSTKCIQVHHLTYKNVFNEEPSDLILLCESCHEKEHGVG